MRRHIDEFPLGEQDFPDRLMIPEKLYGREREVDALLAAFDRVATLDRPELVLVSGNSGVGKSSVVNELHKVLVPPRALCSPPASSISTGVTSLMPLWRKRFRILSVRC